MFQEGIPAVGARPLSPSITNAPDAMPTAGEACPICFAEDAVDPQTTACGHVFCGDCLERALAVRPVCPLCRRPQEEESGYGWLQCEPTPSPEVLQQPVVNGRGPGSLAGQLGRYVARQIDDSMRQSLRLGRG